jgi:hypothetical protein
LTSFKGVPKRDGVAPEPAWIDSHFVSPATKKCLASQCLSEDVERLVQGVTGPPLIEFGPEKREQRIAAMNP